MNNNESSSTTASQPVRSATRRVSTVADSRLLAIVPAELPGPLALEVVKAFGHQAVVMFALHDPGMRDLALRIMDQKLQLQGVDLKAIELLDILTQSIIAALEAEGAIPPQPGADYM